MKNLEDTVFLDDAPVPTELANRSVYEPKSVIDDYKVTIPRPARERQQESYVPNEYVG